MREEAREAHEAAKSKGQRITRFFLSPADRLTRGNGGFSFPRLADFFMRVGEERVRRGALGGSRKFRIVVVRAGSGAELVGLEDDQANESSLSLPLCN